MTGTKPKLDVYMPKPATIRPLNPRVTYVPVSKYMTISNILMPTSFLTGKKKPNKPKNKTKLNKTKNNKHTHIQKPQTNKQSKKEKPDKAFPDKAFPWSLSPQQHRVVSEEKGL